MHDAVYAELPAVGLEVDRGEPVGIVESPGAVFEVVSPVAGTVVAVNRAVEDSPETITADPFGAGWLFTVRPSGDSGKDALLNAEQYERIASAG